jgi:predicted DNA binding protein
MSSQNSVRSPEVMKLRLDLWHPNCWTIHVTEATDAGLLGHGVYTSMDSVAKGRFTVYGDSTAEIDALVQQTRDSDLTRSVMRIKESWDMRETEVAAPGNTTQEMFVEFDPENSIDKAFVSRGFVYDGPTRIKDGHEKWSLVIHNDRREVQQLLDEIREEMDADIDVLSISTRDHPKQDSGAQSMSRLSERQREVFLFAREHGYYEWPRNVTARELAEEFDITKTTFLEHLRKAESKLLTAVE